MFSEKLSVVLIGLGNIGCLYDLNDSLHGEFCLSHAAAFSKHPAFNLLAGVDPNQDRMRAFQNKYSVDVYSQLLDIGDKILSQVDIFVLAVPTGLHLDLLEQLIVYSPRLIVCEKPLGTQFKKAKKIVDILTDKGIPVWLNYPRIFMPEIRSLLESFHSGSYGEITGGSITYCRGFLNNCSHYLDLLQLLIGEPLGDMKAEYAKFKAGFGQDDFCADVMLTFNNDISIFCQYNKASYYSGRLSLFTTRGLLVIDEQGRIFWCAHEDSCFGDFTLSKPNLLNTINVSQFLRSLVDEIYNFICLEKQIAFKEFLQRDLRLISIYDSLRKEFDLC